MEERTKIHVGLDVHKDSISVAAAELGRAPARLIGKLTHDLNKLLKVLTKIGTAEDRPVLKRLQDSPEADARIGAASGSLYLYEHP